ncbi:MAG: sulfite exporter TauE/SafE family protein [Clostridia bacterium]|nr:sulfite exporter TauE/SafE family protein [Clostridia bacterium]
MNYLLTFLEGFASFISPCILPMVPIYISYFAGNSENKKGKTLLHAIAFVLGFTLAFVAFAVLASSLGVLLSSATKYIKIVFGILIILFGLNYLGIFRIGFLNRSIALETDLKKMNFGKAFLFGLLFSISWTPCVGAFLSSALLLIAKQQDMLKGIILILLYSIGLGIPFVISALIIEKLKSTFAFIKKHYGVIQKISGIILIAMGIYVIFF